MKRFIFFVLLLFAALSLSAQRPTNPGGAIPNPQPMFDSIYFYATNVDTVKVLGLASNPARNIIRPPSPGMILVAGSVKPNGAVRSFWVWPYQIGLGSPELTADDLTTIAGQVGDQFATDEEVNTAQIAAQNYADVRAGEVRSALIDTAAAIRLDFPEGGGGLTEAQAAAITGDTATVLRQYADDNDETRDFIPKIVSIGLSETRAKIGRETRHIYFVGDSKIQSRDEFADYVGPAFEDYSLTTLEANHPILNGGNSPQMPATNDVGNASFSGAWNANFSDIAFNGRSVSTTDASAFFSIPIPEGTIIDTAVIYSSGNVSASFRTGGTVENQVTRNDPTPGRLVLPYVQGNTLVVSSVANNLEVYAIHYLSNNENVVHYYNLGRSGSRTFTWFPNYENQFFDEMYDTLSPPQTVVADFGTNDVINSDSATFAADYARMIDYWLGRGSEVLAVGAPAKKLSPTPITPLKVIDRISYETATQKGVGYISHFQIYGSNATGATAGPDGVMPDGVHFSPQYGRENVARIVAEIVGRQPAQEVNAASIFQVSGETDEITSFDVLKNPGLYPKIFRSDNPGGPPVKGTDTYFYVHNIVRSVNDIVQTVYPLDNNRSATYQRISRSGVWGPWLPMTSGRSYDVGNGVDWNTLTEFGLQNRIIRGDGANGPGEGTYYFVNNYRRGAVIHQEAIPWDKNLQKQWRVYDGSNWSAWRVPATLKGIFNPTGAENSSFNWNTITAPGTHPSIVVSNSPNGPGGSPNTFYFVTNYTRANSIFQEARRYQSTGNVGYAYRTSSDLGVTWSSWVKPEISSYTFDGNFGGQKGTNMAEGTNVTDAATYGQVLGAVDGTFDQVTPDGNGDATITHAGGTIPTAIHCKAEGPTMYHVQVQSKTATNFVVRIFDTAGLPVTSGTIPVSSILVYQ